MFFVICMINSAPEEAKAIRQMNINQINMGLNWNCILLMCFVSHEKKPVYDDILHACDII